MPREEPRGFEAVLVTANHGTVAVAKSILEAAGIPFVVDGEVLQQLTGINVLAQFVEIQVPKESAATARELLSQLRSDEE